MKKRLQQLGILPLTCALFGVASAQGTSGSVRNVGTDTVRTTHSPGTGRRNNPHGRQRKDAVVGPEVADEDPKQAEQPDYFSLGTKSFEEKKYDEALTYFTKDLAVDPGNPAANAYLGDTNAALKRFDEAVRDYRAAIDKLKPEDKDGKAAFYFKMGLAYGELNDSRGAVEAYQKAVESKPDFPDAYENMAVSDVKLASWQEAVNSYTTMLGLPDAKPDADIYSNLGQAYEKLGKLQEAAESYNKSLALKESLETLFKLCRVNYQGKSWQGVVDACGKTANLDKSQVAVYYYLGDAYSELEQLPQAAAAYQEAARLNPKDFNVLISLGVTYSNMSQHADAVAAFKQALTLDPGSTDTHFKLGQVYSNAGMWADALTELNYVIASQPSNVKAYVLSGRASNRLERMEDAVRFFNQALEKEPGNDEANYYLGTVYIKLRNYAASVEQYNRLHGANSPRADRLLKEIRQNFPAQ